MLLQVLNFQLINISSQIMNQKKQLLTQFSEKVNDYNFIFSQTKIKEYRGKSNKENKEIQFKTKKNINTQSNNYENYQRQSQTQMIQSIILKAKKISKKQEPDQKLLSSSQVGLKLPSIQGKQKPLQIINIDFKKSLKQQSLKSTNNDQLIQCINLEPKQDQQSLKRSNTHLYSMLQKPKKNSQKVSFYNVKGLSVSNPKVHKKTEPQQINNNLEQSINKNEEIKCLKQQTKKQIAHSKVIKKKSIIKKQKKFNNSYWDFIFFINWTNQIQHLIQPTTTYKAWIGNGNNSILVKNTLKNRFWWNIVDNPDPIDTNLSWTQSRNMKILDTLRKKQEKQCQFSISKRTYSQGGDMTKQKFLLFQIPKQKQKGYKIKSFCLQNNGLRKLASKKALQNSKDNYSIQIHKQKTLTLFNQPNSLRMHNHLEFNWNLSNKKALYFNLKTYYETCKLDPFDYIPVTFHVKSEGDKQWINFVNYYNARNQFLKQKKQIKQQSNKQVKNKKKKQKNVWIIKPGENSNRGCGIDVCQSIEGIKQILKLKAFRHNGQRRTHIIQSYIMPFLYCKRKFDIRCYILITSVNNNIKGYWYEEGYIRTSSKQFTLKNLSNRMIHLTNDAIQKKSEDYGKFENANKISFAQFQKYLDNNYSQSEYNFYTQIYPNMISLASDAIRSTFLSLDSNKRQYTFEVFGLDFMIDQNFKVWLIQVNTNPCLQLSSPLLARIIPSMLQNAFKIGLDPIFPPPKQWPKKKIAPTQIFENNKFSLIFDSLQQSASLKQKLSINHLQNLIQIEQQSEMEDDQ